MNGNTDIGYLIVKTVAALETVPVEGSVITVRNMVNGSPTTYAVRFTNEDGKTEPISIPAPSKSLSQKPGGTVAPYSLINIEAFAEGYYPVAITNVPIYSGVTSLQTVNMIPLPDLYNVNQYPQNDIIINESEAPNL